MDLQTLLDELMGEVEFDYQDWWAGESAIMEKLHEKGWGRPYFFGIDQDSFGPLVRGLSAVNPKTLMRETASYG